MSSQFFLSQASMSGYEGGFRLSALDAGLNLRLRLHMALLNISLSSLYEVPSHIFALILSFLPGRLRGTNQWVWREFSHWYLSEWSSTIPYVVLSFWTLPTEMLSKWARFRRELCDCLMERGREWMNMYGAWVVEARDMELKMLTSHMYDDRYGEWITYNDGRDPPTRTSRWVWSLASQKAMKKIRRYYRGVWQGLCTKLRRVGRKAQWAWYDPGPSYTPRFMPFWLRPIVFQPLR